MASLKAKTTKKQNLKPWGSAPHPARGLAPLTPVVRYFLAHGFPNMLLQIYSNYWGYALPTTAVNSVTINVIHEPSKTKIGVKGLAPCGGVGAEPPRF